MISNKEIREIQSPLGDGNVHEFTHNFVGAQIREIQSPLGDGNINSLSLLLPL